MVRNPLHTTTKTATQVTNPDGTVSATLEVDEAGDVISYEITVENTGNTTLTGVNVDDPLTGTVDAVCGTGTLLPGEGGYIQTCDDAKPVCKMNFGNGRTGWVAMGSMAGVSNG